MALAMKDTSGDIICRSDGNAKCSIALSDEFTLVVLATKPPVAGYVLAQVWIEYGSVLGYMPAPVPADEATWPDASFSLRFLLNPTAVSLAALTGLIPPLPVSFFVGEIFAFAFACTSTPSSTQVQLLPYLDPPAGTAGAVYKEAQTRFLIIPEVGSLTVNCVTPAAVGGVALDKELAPLGALEAGQQRGRDWGFWIAGAAVGVVAVVVVLALVSRRRRSRS